MVKKCFSRKHHFQRKYDVQGDEDDRMILVKIVIIDCAIFNIYIYILDVCSMLFFFRSQCATNTNPTARSHAVGKSTGSPYEENSHRL